MEVWVLDAGVFSSHSLYMSNAEITWALIIPGRRWYEKWVGGQWKQHHHVTNFLSYFTMVSTIFLLNPYITRMLGLVG